jgi:hypothetical protein
MDTLLLAPQNPPHQFAAILPQGLTDTMTKPPEAISRNMTAAMCVYSALFMRFAWAIQPRNHLLFACHFSNELVQLNQMRRWATVQPWAAQYGFAAEGAADGGQ